MHTYKQHVRPKARGRMRRRPTHRIIAEIIEKIFANREGCVSIAIGGPGGTGKSTLTNRLAETLKDAAILPLDAYKTSRSFRRNAGVFGPHPSANKMQKIKEHLAAIKRGETFDMPVYDRATGDTNGTRPYRPTRYNLIDGETATYREFHDLTDFSIFIDSDWRTQLATRLNRDLQERVYSPEKAVATFLHSNLREFSEHGAESKNWADIHLFCHADYRLELEAVSNEIYTAVNSLLHDTLELVKLEKLIVPLLSPFDKNGAIACRSFVEHLDWLTNAGVKRILVGGTTGEFFSMSTEERLELLKLALEYFPGLTMFHAGGGALCDALEMAQRAEELGADAVFCLPPCYYANAPTDGIAAFFEKVAERIKIPLILYNFPQHTQNPITPEISSKIPHFGMKDSSGDLSLIAATPNYFIGADTMIHQGLQAGAAGFVSAGANVEPAPYLEMESLMDKGLPEETQQAQQTIMATVRAMGKDPTPALKQMLQQKIPSYPVNVRPPLMWTGTVKSIG